MEKKRSGAGKPKPKGKAKPQAKPEKEKPNRALILSPQARKSEEKAKPGRPTDYSVEITTAICERMVNGESLRSICRDAAMPDLSTVFRWKDKHPEFREQYAHAREMQAEVLAEEIIEIASTPMIGVRRKVTPRGPEVIEVDMVERSKLMVDARKWSASRILWKIYGDKPQDTGDKENPLKELLGEFRKRHEAIKNGQT